MMRKMLSSIIIVAMLLTVITPSQLVYTYAFTNDTQSEVAQLVQAEEESDSTEELITEILPEINSEEATSEDIEVGSEEDTSVEAEAETEAETEIGPETEIYEPTEDDVTNDITEDVAKAAPLKIMPMASTVIIDDTDSLKSAIAAAPTRQETLIEISDDIILTDVIVIAATKYIKISSEAGKTCTIEPKSGERHFDVRGKLTLENIVLEGENQTPNQGYGGVKVTTPGHITVGTGATIKNCYNKSGGAIQSDKQNTIITINGGTISNNKAEIGGGIHSIGDLVLTDATIINNEAMVPNPTLVNRSYGGGINARKVTVLHSNISSNKADVGAGMLINNYLYSIPVSGSDTHEEYISTIDNSEISDNIATSMGGGIYVTAGTLKVINSSKISGNGAGEKGAGIYLSGVVIAQFSGFAFLQMENSSIIYNGMMAGSPTPKQGGGIYLQGDFISSGPSSDIKSSIIENNFADDGGGIFVRYGEMQMNDSDINQNLAAQNGAGVYIDDEALTDISGGSRITNNTATNGNGGGIYTAKTTYKNIAADYDNIATASDTIFTGNIAKAEYNPPANAQTLYPNMKFNQVSTTLHPLNGYDINYYYETTGGGSGGGGGTSGGTTSEGTTQAPATTATEDSGENMRPSAGEYTLIYNANGGKGKDKNYTAEFGDSHFVLSTKTTGHTFAGYRFVEWNTQPNGGGEAYKIDDVIVVTEHVTLYAQWIEDDGIIDESGEASTIVDRREKQTTIRPAIRRSVGSPSTGIQDTVMQHFLGLGISFLLIVSLIWTSKRRAE